MKIAQSVKQEKLRDFGIRLKKAFAFASNTEIARALKLSNSAISTYMDGRVPPAETLTEISRLTGYSIHWLLMGEGPERVGENTDRRSKTQTIVLANLKGGEAKSTSATGLAIELARRGYRTLLVDTPSGCCTSYIFAYHLSGKTSRPTDAGTLLDHRLTRRALYGRVFFKTPIENLHLCASREEDQAQLLSKRIESFLPDLSTVSDTYSFIVLDTASGRPFDSIEFLLASLLTQVHVLIPTIGYPLSITGVERTIRLFRDKQKKLSNLDILGIFITKFAPDMCNLKVVTNELNRLLPDKLLRTLVHFNKAFVAQSNTAQNQFIQTRSKVAAEYSTVTDEVLMSLGTTAISAE